MKLLQSIWRPLALALLASIFGTPSLAAAPDQPGWKDRHTNGNVNKLTPSLDERGPSFGGHGHLKNRDKPGHLPELDPSAAGSAAVLLVGGTLVMLGRRRQEQAL